MNTSEAVLLACVTGANIGLFFACLKLYTEIMKEKSQRNR